MSTLTGLDVLIKNNFEILTGKRISVVCNQASIAKDLRHILAHLRTYDKQHRFLLTSVFGPQHGLWGHTQDNMVEWEASDHERVGFRVYSLYGEHRQPTDDMLSNTDVMVVDLPDVGARYYTFIWTMALCMKACERLSIPILVLDRPNPIGGIEVEGTVLEPAFASFVGLYPLPTRHGMTMGEIATYLRHNFFPKLTLNVQKMEEYDRSFYFEDTRLPWAMPSPNMPGVDTAVVYPGGCLLEGTTLSEGRGTTRPFETIGAPYVDAWSFCERLNALRLPGVYFRPVQFQPTFQKHAGSICEGAFIHVTDRGIFKPFLSYVAVIREAAHMYENLFEWKSPPYEYEFTRLPIDILAGNQWLRESVQKYEPLDTIQERTETELSKFAGLRYAALLY